MKKKISRIGIISIFACQIIVIAGLIGMTANHIREYTGRNSSEGSTGTVGTSGLDVYKESETFVETETGDISGDEEVVWLRVDGFSESKSITVPMGTVQISKCLAAKLVEYPENTVFAVAICFRSMIPENYLDIIQEEGITAEQYRLKGIELSETDPEAARKALATYHRLKDSYFDTTLDSLQYAGEKWVPAFACRELFLFYTYMTKDEILSLKCGEKEALYIFAPDMLM